MTSHRINLHPHRAAGQHTIKSAGLTVWWWAVLAAGVTVLTTIVMFTLMLIVNIVGEIL